jgi:hypothetical protein
MMEEKQWHTHAPVWYLDVDGVLNAFRHSGPNWDDSTSFWAKDSDGGKWQMRWSPAMIKRILEVQELGVEIRWLTTWGHDANYALAGTFGLPELKVHAVRPPRENMFGGYPWDWKWHALRATVAKENRPVIWTDDDAWDDGIEITLKSICKAMDRDLLMIRPDPDIGLSKDNLDQIYRFASMHKALVDVPSGD